MLPRLASFLRLPASERRLAVRALVILAAVRLALHVRSFPQVRTAVDRWSGDAAPSLSDVATAQTVRRAIERAVRTLPGSACLAQALAAEVLLRRAGQAVQLSIGVAPGDALATDPSLHDASVRGTLARVALNAHAWARSAGVLVAGEREDLETYRTLAVFGAERPASH